MAGYFETGTFGGGGVAINTLTGGKDYFLGTVYGPSGRTQTSAAAAKGIDYGETFGSYRHRLQVCIYCTQPIAFVGAAHQPTDIEVELMESTDNSTFKGNGKFTIPLAKLNASDSTPIMFTPISINARYMAARFKFIGPSVATSDVATAGNILITLEPTTF